MKQTSSHIMMVQPTGFRYNEQTAANNFYQEDIELSNQKVQEKALAEFNAFAENLRNHGIRVHVFKDTLNNDTPDSVFPNNWVSFHEDGTVVLYPMFAPNRRLERRSDVIEELKTYFEVRRIVDLSSFENEGKFLEGTGSLELDRENKLAYAALSERTHPDLLREFCRKFGYEPIAFRANQTVDGQRLPIYHTNVMMHVGFHLALVCLDAIDDVEERNMVVKKLEASGKEIVRLTENQLVRFAGNALELRDSDNRYNLVMSSAAYTSLDSAQLAQINKYCKVIHSPLDTIEACGGGSARCMMAEIFLPPKDQYS